MNTYMLHALCAVPTDRLRVIERCWTMRAPWLTKGKIIRTHVGGRMMHHHPNLLFHSDRTSSLDVRLIAPQYIAFVRTAEKRYH